MAIRSERIINSLFANQRSKANKCKFQLMNCPDCDAGRAQLIFQMLLPAGNLPRQTTAEMHKRADITLQVQIGDSEKMLSSLLFDVMNLVVQLYNCNCIALCATGPSSGEIYHVQGTQWSKVAFNSIIRQCHIVLQLFPLPFNCVALCVMLFNCSSSSNWALNSSLEFLSRPGHNQWGMSLSGHARITLNADENVRCLAGLDALIWQ